MQFHFNQQIFTLGSTLQSKKNKTNDSHKKQMANFSQRPPPVLEAQPVQTLRLMAFGEGRRFSKKVTTHP